MGPITLTASFEFVYEDSTKITQLAEKGKAIFARGEDMLQDFAGKVEMKVEELRERKKQKS
jgi:hypothetical protein